MPSDPSGPTPQSPSDDIHAPPSKGDLTQGPIKGHLIRLTLPMTWGIFAIISFQLVDTFYVSMLGTQELAALSFTFPITMIIFSTFIGFQIATSSIVSRLIGERDMDTARRFVTHAVLLVFGLGILTATAGLLLHDPIFTLIGAEEDMLPMIWSYMSVWFAGAIFVTTPMVENASMRATGDSMTPAIIMTLVAVINIVLDPLLIFGLAGFPRLELQGAAIATIFANACAALAGLYIVYAKKKLINPISRFQLHLFANSAKRFFMIALPAGLTGAIQPLVNAIILSLLAYYGHEAVAAFGVATRVEAFTFVILMALSTGMAPIIGQNFGAKNFDRVNETLKLSIRFCILWSAGIAIVLGTLAEPIASLFSDHPDVIHYAILFFWLVPFSYAFSNLIMGWGSAFNAMGMPVRSLTMIVVKMIVLMIPAIYIGNTIGEVAGIFIAMAIVNTLSGAVFHILNWKKCHQMEKARQQAPE